VIGIVVSRADEASEHVGDHLLELGDFERVEAAAYRADGFELREIEDLHIHAGDAAAVFDAAPDLVVFVSRHSGETGPLLSAHYTGNFGAAEFGGADRSLAPACPNAHHAVMAGLREYAPERYEVAMECTHHGPTSVGAPSMFVELGSDEPEWRDPEGARAVARAVLDLGDTDPRADRALVAFGGGHYAPRATRILAETDWPVGHVAADWSLDDLGDPREHREVIKSMFAASGAEYAVVDGEQPALRATVSDLGFDVVSETWVRETDGVPLDLAASLEAHVGAVDDGLRFGAPAGSHEGGYRVVDLPGDLLEAAHAVDPEAAVEAARERALAVLTAENGNRLAGPAAFAAGADYDALVDDLADLLADDYDEVARERAELTAVRETFDPEAAAAVGVPEGPAYGKLASGQAVEYEGTTVTPDEVARTETITVPVALRERARERVRRPSDAEGKGN
jgi:D-aminoacyl-tRNA deacylase